MIFSNNSEIRIFKYLGVRKIVLEGITNEKDTIYYK
ncbi:hypothetical protein SDC9_52170 [bioreactor metagenome]|uniref:Uncharacterized protein n=1 Tax=bioreactor metagenome TaxID=1076179 RepID=A0A644WPR9_9ZZZZ